MIPCWLVAQLPPQCCAVGMPIKFLRMPCNVVPVLLLNHLLSATMVCVRLLPVVLDQLLSDLGKLLALMHDGGVVHSALSSSCVLVRHSDQALVRCCWLLQHATVAVATWYQAHQQPPGKPACS